MVLFPGYGAVQFFVNVAMACVKAAIPDHFIMLFRDMLDEPFDEFHNGNRFFYIGIILMTVVMESNHIAIIVIDARGGNHRASKVTPDVFDNGMGITFVGPGIDVEAVLMLAVTARLYLFEREPDFFFHLIEQSGTEGISEEGIIEVTDIAPEAFIRVSTLRNKAMNVRIPF